MNELADVVDGEIRSGHVDQSLIEQAKQEWESAVDLMPQIICVLDAGGRVIRINRTAECWGLNTVEEACGLTLHQLFHPGCTDENCRLHEFWSQARLALDNGCRASYLADDRKLGRYVEMVVRPSRDAREISRGDHRIFAVALVDDVTEAKQAEARLLGQKSELDAQLQLGNEQLKQAYDRLRELSAQLVNIQEQERQRIAAELHDGIGQSLSIIKFGIEDARRGLTVDSVSDTRGMLEILSGKVKGAIDEVRQVTMDLRPSILDDFGIIATIGWFVREFKWIYRDITVHQEITLTEADVPAELKTTIYRILQEAMNNIAKHTRTATVCIRFGIEQGTIELAIEDSGAGFDVTQVMARTGCDKGYGLISMRDRALLSGGDYQIVSRAGQGTLIQVSWPMV